MASRIPPEQRSKSLQSYYRNIEARRAINRQRAKEAYYRDKAAKLTRNKAWQNENLDKWKEIKRVGNAKYNKRRFFFMRAFSCACRTDKIGDANEICTALSRAWYNQRGRCAYTGRKLTRAAHVDHKTPISKGGTNDASNLHWIIPEANMLKGTMTHEEFLALASDISEYIKTKCFGAVCTPPAQEVYSEPTPAVAWRTTPGEKNEAFPPFSKVGKKRPARAKKKHA